MRQLHDLIYPAKTNFSVWEPKFVSDRYETINKRGETTCKISFDKLIAMYDKFNLQKNTYNAKFCDTKIIEYIYEPKNYKYTILLSAGMNGCEITGILGLYYFIKLVLNSKEPGLTWIRENCKLCIIPVISSYSFDNQTYTNINKVNINRNFNYNNNWYAIPSNKGTWNYSGICQESEEETQILREWFSSNKNADLYIDCHTDVTRKHNKPLEKTFDAIASSKEIQNRVLNVQELIKMYYEKFGLNPTEPWCTIAGPTDYPKSLIAQNEYNIPNIIIEQHAADKGHNGNGMVCSNADLKNYIMMLRGYILTIKQ